MAATWGVAMLVPSRVLKSPPGQDEWTETPGPLMFISPMVSIRQLLKYAMFLFMSTAATAIMDGQAAGFPVGLV